jgi:hypothetical protein
MCILVVVPAHAKLPSKNELLAMHRANPHGMGFACKSMHYKGMNFERFYNRLQFVPEDEDVIIHFRFATHGSVCVQNCHPFHKGGIWFAHNGILDIEPIGDMTDSETAFTEYIYPTIKEFGIDSQEVNWVIDEIIDYSKFALLGRDGKVRRYGNFTEFNGRYYSNMRHLTYLRPRYKWAM